MKGLTLPKCYKNKLDLRTTEKALKFVKDNFETNFAKGLCLERVSAPLMVISNTGVNDDLNGVERAVKFDVKALNGKDAEIVHSLAKWKRMALKKYGYRANEGLYTDMNAIRRDEELDNIHSIYVDQWDWEMVISKDERNVEFLKNTVKKIVSIIADTAEDAIKAFPALDVKICRDVKFITSEELLQMYPDKSPKEREAAICKKFSTVFLMNIGGKLSDGQPHDGRAPDYDDWSLNGDILLWNDVLQIPFEVSSMGIRVNKESLISQLKEANAENRLKYSYHKQIIEEQLPLTIGGGIGQSRLCMFILQKAHIGEIQVSLWDEDMDKECKEHGIFLL